MTTPTVDIQTLRDLQNAANGLSYNDFLTALGWARDDYSLHKWHEFQGLGRLGVFDDGVLARLIAYHRAQYK